MSTFLAALTFAAGAVFTWQGADNASWQDENSYVEPGKPEAGDVITIPRDKNPVVTDADFDYVSGLSLVELQVKCSVTFDVTGERTLNCAVRQKASEISSYTREGVLIKDGDGTLTLAAPLGSVTPYMAEVRVKAGTLRYSADTYGGKTLSCVLWDVSDGATLDLGGVAQYTIGQIFGDGTITNSFENGNSLIYIERKNATSDFGGKILGNITLRATSEGATMNLTGTESDFHTFYTHNVSTVGVAKFGLAGEPSSIGTNEWMEAKANGARFVYLGEDGEETDKKLTFDNSSVPMIMDGGAHGGVTFTGIWGWTGSTRYMRRLVLDGSNTVNACVFAGPYDDYGTSGYATYITKKGPGIWRLADNADRKNHGVIAVEDGTLRFDSIAEAGEVCSLGLASALYADYYGKDILSENAVPYALLLGGGTTEGTLEYTGSEDASCTSRLVAVKGPARLRNATDNDFYLKGVTGLGEGTRVLALDGDSMTADNRLEAVTGGTGALSIAKDGAGTWTLAGDQKLNGGTIDVKAGTLVIERKAVVPTWYRFTVKQCMMYSLVNRGLLTQNDRSRSYDKTLFLNELAFYDANGVRCNAGITEAAAGTAVGDLQAGQVLQTMGVTVSARSPARLFDGSGTGDGWHAKNEAYDYYMTPETPQTWIQVVFRPKTADLGKVIAAYDFANTYTSSSNLKYQRWYQPDIFTVEGSADGENWTVLTNVLESAENITGGHWNSDDGTVSNADRPGKGFPVDGRLHADVAFDGVSAVSVAKDATLKADVADGDKFVIRGLTLDPADGAGTIDGFDFAEDGIFNLKTLPQGGSSYKFTLMNSSGFENVGNWTVRLNGEETTRYDIGVKPTGEVTILRKGLILMVR